MKIDHNGYEITFSEYSEEWTCQAISMSHASLKKLKELIGKYDLKMRTLPKIEALIVGYRDATFEPCLITSIAATEDRYAKCGEAWVSKTEKLRGRAATKERQKVSLSRLIPDTKENREAIAAAKKLVNQADQLKSQAEALIDACPRYTIEQLREIAGQQLDEENAE